VDGLDRIDRVMKVRVVHRCLEIVNVCCQCSLKYRRDSDNVDACVGSSWGRDRARLGKDVGVHSLADVAVCDLWAAVGDCCREKLVLGLHCSLELLNQADFCWALDKSPEIGY